ncbi:MAG: branched-chain-amino-acid transaminase [Syntrophomonas sp.]|uniref:Branched-chain-amino-acid aminotransferase n=1 Tax=Syntrophomonas wolfei subsp. wolfei (strain DSM 2245B / Goettingen) TaxID=335541 RepID=Q0AV15_SYNWW|nr:MULTISPECIES: branched-chain-amino-acid transaminase [Syntrophomonas]ABI69439.1 branched chain amino acid aminotransferase [Syntrophomonas wolfei subsp. wolfei str. Goettingen G311]MDD2510796.1 branched-chain-amino-acid transaminase [Syntrophomonas sp.]MDD4627215.1 branched-chain-amino-acid transaminase [Syntrophomonas sp.]
MGLKIYLDGKFVDEEEAKVSVFDHGFLYGDGVFEGIRAYHNSVFRLKDHVDRLYDSAKAVNMEIPVNKEQMSEIILESCRQNDLKDAYIRVVVSRGKGDLGLDPRKCSVPTVVCIASSISIYPEEMYEKGLDVITVPTRRNGPEGVNPRIKSLNYLNNIMAKIEANMAGVPEAILLNQEGYVAECTGDNIFMVKNGILKTPAIHLGLLEGVTRNEVIAIARKEGIDVQETTFTRYDLFVADEVFLTGTAAELIPVVKVDDRVIADGKPGPIFHKLLQQFREIVKEPEALIFK